MEIIDAVQSGQIATLLAAIVVVLGTVIAALALALFREMQSRVKRAEGLVDRAMSLFDELKETTKAALDDRRRR